MAFTGNNLQVNHGLRRRIVPITLGSLANRTERPPWIDNPGFDWSAWSFNLLAILRLYALSGAAAIQPRRSWGSGYHSWASRVFGLLDWLGLPTPERLLQEYDEENPSLLAEVARNWVVGLWELQDQCQLRGYNDCTDLVRYIDGLRPCWEGFERSGAVNMITTCPRLREAVRQYERTNRGGALTPIYLGREFRSAIMSLADDCAVFDTVLATGQQVRRFLRLECRSASHRNVWQARVVREEALASA
jgi:hypothetical protein